MRTQKGALYASTILAGLVALPMMANAQLREGRPANEHPNMGAAAQPGQPANQTPGLGGTSSQATTGATGAITGQNPNPGSQPTTSVMQNPQATGNNAGSVPGAATTNLQPGPNLGATQTQGSAITNNPPGSTGTRAMERTTGENLNNSTGINNNPVGTNANRDGAPGNPPGTAASRAFDRAAGTNTSGAFPAQSDGTPGNPPGTAAGRALDRATAPGAANSSTSSTGTTSSSNASTTNTGVTGPAGAASATQAGMTGNFAERPRVSQIIGSRVYNDRGESIGEVDDVLLTQGGQGPVAVIQIGGFLGIGGRLVTVPLNDLRWAQDRERWTLPGASKEDLERRPAFEYNSLRRS